MEFREFSRYYKVLVEERLAEALDRDIEPSLKEAMSYSLLAGGKRIRPLLVFATIEALQGDMLLGVRPASALEMIHTYSLIHDDLPSMDNDDYRRGKLTNHKVFGEAAAILAGDALLTLAFTELSEADEISELKRLEIIQNLAFSAGAFGMVGGQQADILGEKKQLTLDELAAIHRRKTGALLCSAVYAGSVIGGANEEETKRLQVFAENIGIAFQICDDILDVIGDTATLGKEAGKDAELSKSTYPSLLTLDGA
ncbi:geranyltranstransferase [Listeria floridensis FSL S10-1187]|uniref:Geranyltranstransferase n=1 Tax=Listeria floridensis FSL S10-1187 TaxID=1265817 RepID=A0ABN0RF00_9LIST|nr:geranyltranstransferase [Listeria floridensis FSL S10-1187]